MTTLFAYPDQELLIVTLLDATGVAPAGTWLPPNFEPPYWQVRRVGGGADPSDVTDIGVVQVHSFGTTRAQAQIMSAIAQDAILGHRGRAVEVDAWGRVLIDFVDLATGPSEVQDLDPDDRRVTVDLAVGCRRATLTLED